MAKSRDAFRTISEVAEWLDTPAHVLRFWESKFSQVKPVKRAGGRRYYRPTDMALLGGIKKLLHDDGLTIKGVQKVMREQGVKHVASLCALPIDGETATESQPAGTEDKADLPMEEAPFTETEDAGNDVQVLAFKPLGEEPPKDSETAAEPVEGAEVGNAADQTDDLPAPSDHTEKVIFVAADDAAPDTEAGHVATEESATDVLQDAEGEDEPTSEIRESDVFVGAEGADDLHSDGAAGDSPEAFDISLADETSGDAADTPSEETMPEAQLHEAHNAAEAQAETDLTPEPLAASTEAESFSETDADTTEAQEDEPEVLRPTGMGLFGRHIDRTALATDAPVETEEADETDDDAAGPEERPDGAMPEAAETVQTVQLAESSSSDEWPALLSRAARLTSLTPAQAEVLAPHVARLRAHQATLNQPIRK